MKKWFLAAGVHKIKRLYARAGTATRLLESREKSLIELGNLTHRKIGAGQIADPDLKAVSEVIDGWDRLLGRTLQQSESGAVAVRTNAKPDASPDSAGAGETEGPLVEGNGTEMPFISGHLRSLFRHGLFGAFLSVMLTLALCLAISTIANMAINQAAASGKEAIADKVQGKLDEVKPDSLNGKLGTQATEKIRELVESKWSALQQFQREADFELLHASDTYLLVHNVKSAAHIQLGSSLASSEMQLQIGFYALLLIPLLAFLIGGYVSARQMRVASAAHAIGLSLVIGAANALFLVLLTQATGFSAAIALPHGIGGADVVYRFSASSALLNGFVLGTAFSLTGAMLRLGGIKWAKQFRSSGHPYSVIVWCAAATILCGVGLCLVYALILLLATGTLSTMIVVLLPQLAIYSWGIASGGIFHMTNFIVGQGKQIEISIFGGIRGDGMEVYAADWNLFLLLSALIPILLLLLAGLRMKPAIGASSSSRQALLVFSFSYASLMSLLMVLSQIGLTVRGQAAFLDVKSFAMEAGFSTLSTFVASWIVAYACAGLGMLLRERRNSNK